MTELTITPDYGKKRLKFAGTVAAGEHVAVTVAGAGDWASAEGAKLRLRVLFGRTLVGMVGGDYEAESPWDTTTSQGDAICELDLNTVEAEKWLRCGGNCFWVLDDAVNNTLYGSGEWEVMAWPKREGQDEPYSLDEYPDIVAELQEAWEAYKDSTAEAYAAVAASIADKIEEVDEKTSQIDGKVESSVSSHLDGKANKVSSPTEDNFAALSAGGDLKDSGKSAEDFAPASHAEDDDIHVTAVQKAAWSAKQDAIEDLSSIRTKANSAYQRPGDGIPKSDLQDDVKASLAKADSAIQQHQDISGKASVSSVEAVAEELATHKANTYTKEEVDAIADVLKNGRFIVVDELPDPEEAETKSIYLVPREESETGNVYDEYVVVSDEWEMFGSTDIDLSNYVQKETGKGLSSNDYTNTEKQKLNGIEAGAQVNTVTGVKGDAEQNYRTGNINLTPSDIGAATSSQGAKADTAYQKPAGGIPKTDLSSGVQSSLGKADTALQSVKVNGAALTPDADKAVDVTVPQASDTAPIVAGAATAGSSGAFSRGDHVHPTDISRAPIESPAFSGTPTAPTPTSGDNSTKVATTAFVQDALPYAIASVPSGDALADRTVNTKTVNAATYAPSFPAETSGKSCDFYLAITSDTAGTVSAPSGKTLNNAKGESANLDYEANKTTVLRFTQISANTYVVTGGANGGGSVDPAQLAGKLDATSAAPAFSDDSSVSYAVGAHVTYNGKLYSCTTATTGGTWVAGSWTADTMTDPDAVLDITSQNQLRVVAKDGTLLWTQGYDLASTSSAILACDADNNFTFADGATTQAFALPTAPTGKVGDFILDIDNSANTGAATMALTGLDTAFSVVVPKDESLTNMLVITVGELARFYITLTTFRINNLPTWHIVKQVVENGGATV